MSEGTRSRSSLTIDFRVHSVERANPGPCSRNRRSQPAPRPISGNRQLSAGPDPGRSGVQNSSSTVIGPSFTSSTSMSAPNRPVSHRRPEAAQLVHHGRHQRLGDGSGRRGGPGRAAALAGVAVERELAHHEHAGPGASATLALAAQDAQTVHLAGQRRGRRGSVAVRHADQHEQAGADPRRPPRRRRGHARATPAARRPSSRIAGFEEAAPDQVAHDRHQRRGDVVGGRVQSGGEHVHERPAARVPSHAADQAGDRVVGLDLPAQAVALPQRASQPVVQPFGARRRSRARARTTSSGAAQRAASSASSSWSRSHRCRANQPRMRPDRLLDRLRDVLAHDDRSSARYATGSPDPCRRPHARMRRTSPATRVALRPPSACRAPRPRRAATATTYAPGSTTSRCQTQASQPRAGQPAADAVRPTRRRRGRSSSPAGTPCPPGASNAGSAPQQRRAHRRPRPARCRGSRSRRRPVAGRARRRTAGWPRPGRTARRPPARAATLPQLPLHARQRRRRRGQPQRPRADVGRHDVARARPRCSAWMPQPVPMSSARPTGRRGRRLRQRQGRRADAEHVVRRPAGRDARRCRSPTRPTTARARRPRRRAAPRARARTSAPSTSSTAAGRAAGQRGAAPRGVGAADRLARAGTAARACSAARRSGSARATPARSPRSCAERPTGPSSSCTPSTVNPRAPRATRPRQRASTRASTGAVTPRSFPATSCRSGRVTATDPGGTMGSCAAATMQPAVITPSRRAATTSSTGARRSTRS